MMPESTVIGVYISLGLYQQKTVSYLFLLLSQAIIESGSLRPEKAQMWLVPYHAPPPLQGINSPAEGLEISGWKSLISLELILWKKTEWISSNLQMPTVQPSTTPKFRHPTSPPSSLPSHKGGTIKLFSSSLILSERNSSYMRGRRNALGRV